MKTKTIAFFFVKILIYFPCLQARQKIKDQKIDLFCFDSKMQTILDFQMSTAQNWKDFETKIYQSLWTHLLHQCPTEKHNNISSNSEQSTNSNKAKIASDSCPSEECNMLAWIDFNCKDYSFRNSEKNPIPLIPNFQSFWALFCFDFKVQTIPDFLASVSQNWKDFETKIYQFSIEKYKNISSTNPLAWADFNCKDYSFRNSEKNPIPLIPNFQSFWTLFCFDFKVQTIPDFLASASQNWKDFETKIYQFSIEKYKNISSTNPLAWADFNCKDYSFRNSEKNPIPLIPNFQSFWTLFCFDFKVQTIPDFLASASQNWKDFETKIYQFSIEKYKNISSTNPLAWADFNCKDYSFRNSEKNPIPLIPNFQSSWAVLCFDFKVQTIPDFLASASQNWKDFETKIYQFSIEKYKNISSTNPLAWVDFNCKDYSFRNSEKNPIPLIPNFQSFWAVLCFDFKVQTIPDFLASVSQNWKDFKTKIYQFSIEKYKNISSTNPLAWVDFNCKDYSFRNSEKNPIPLIPNFQSFWALLCFDFKVQTIPDFLASVSQNWKDFKTKIYQLFHQFSIEEHKNISTNSVQSTSSEDKIPCDPSPLSIEEPKNISSNSVQSTSSEDKIPCDPSPLSIEEPKNISSNSEPSTNCNEDKIACISCPQEGYNIAAFVAFDCKEYGYSLWINFLYWDASQEFMEIGFSGPEAFRNNLCGTSCSNGNVINIGCSSKTNNFETSTSNEFKPGFSVGALYALPCVDNWDIFAEYTRFHSSISSQIVAPEDGFLYARFVFPNLISNNSASQINASWKLKMDYMNLGVERISYFGSRFIVNPFCALTAAWINQKIKGDILLNNASPSGNPSSLLLEINTFSKAWAIGPRIGMKGYWYFTSSLSLIGRIAADILFSHYRLKLRQLSEDDPTVVAINSNHFNYLRPEFDMYLGLNYEWYRPGAGYHISIGYDFQVWWNQNMLRWYNDIAYLSTPMGTLYIQGLNVSFGIDF